MIARSSSVKASSAASVVVLLLSVKSPERQLSSYLIAVLGLLLLVEREVRGGMSRSAECTRRGSLSAHLGAGSRPPGWSCIYKDGSVFPHPGLAEVPHVQHMGTMNVSWAFTSPPSGMAMVGQPGGGPIKHLSGLGSRCLRPGLRTPLLNGGGPGGLSPRRGRRCGAPMVGSPSWQSGAGGRVPSPPRRGGTGPSLCLWVVLGCVAWCFFFSFLLSFCFFLFAGFGSSAP